MISQIFDSGSFKVLAVFALSPGSRFRRKELQEKTRLNNVPLDSALSRLASSGIVKKDNNFYAVNMENPCAQQIISILSSQHRQMKALPLDVYFLLVDAAEGLSAARGTELWLFGSYSKLVYTDKSDVDIAIVGPVKKDEIKKAFRKLEKLYSKRTEEHFFDKQEFYKNRKDPLVKDILQNGMRIL